MAVEGDVGPQRRRQAADALAAPSRRQDERLEPAPHLIGLAVGEDERGAPGWLEASVRSDPCDPRLPTFSLSPSLAGYPTSLTYARLWLASGDAAGTVGGMDTAWLTSRALADLWSAWRRTGAVKRRFLSSFCSHHRNKRHNCQGCCSAPACAA
jgi:hypothetical protein